MMGGASRASFPKSVGGGVYTGAMRRTLSWTAVVLTALLLQSTVFAEVTLAGAKPELVYLATIVLAYLEGPSSGSLAGFVGGMSEDFLLNQPKGITALTLTLVGYSVGAFRQYVSSPSPLVPVILVGAATAGGLLFHGLVSFLLGQLVVGFGYVARVALLSGLYNAILTPLVYPVIRRVAESSRPKKVFRW
jgi:rod shape-determining protein MreD